jgi:hypothetical protein
MFSGMFKGEYDISEMSLAEMIYYLTRDQCNFIGIPGVSVEIISAQLHALQRNGGHTRAGRFNQEKDRWFPLGPNNLSAKDTDWHVSALHHWHENGCEEKSRRVTARS